MIIDDKLVNPDGSGRLEYEREAKRYEAQA
jgi:hypothetical protein